MARVYPFLDITVLDGVRERFAAGDALVVLSEDLVRIIWANGSGAQLLGFSGIEDALDQDPGLTAVARRQISALPGFPAIGENRPVAVRLHSGLFFFQASAITLPGGEHAILLAQPAAEEASDAERARRAVAGIVGPGQFAALVDESGSVRAATPGFNTLKLDNAVIGPLLDDLRASPARLLKRRVSAIRSLPIGMARLRDEDPLFLLLVVDDGEEQAVTPKPVRMAAPTAAQAAAVPELHPARSRIPAANPSVPVPASLADSKERIVRFSWRTDADGRFTSISPEFVEAVGEPAADIIGRTFREVSNAFGLDVDGTIQRHMERRDTWSGCSVMWPLAGQPLKVPVDLAGLPVYGRGRVFEGFRGFGVVRLSDAADDPEGIGLVLKTAPTPVETTSLEQAPGEDGEQTEHYRKLPILDELLSDPFEGERPAIAIPKEHSRRAADKSAAPSEGGKSYGLTPAERLAFREIGERLRRANAELASREEEEAPQPSVEEEAEPVPATGPTREPAPTADAGAPASVGTDAGSVPQEHPEQDAEILRAQAEEQPTSEALTSSVSEPISSQDEAPAAKQAEAIPPATELPASPGAEQPSQERAPSERPRQARSLLSLVPSEKPADAARGDTAPDAAARGENAPSAADRVESQAAPSPADDVRNLLAHLPAPVLIHSGDVLHYANREFFHLTGYADLQQLEAAGGIGALFDAGTDLKGQHDSTLSLRTATGRMVPVQTRLQSIPWNGGKALMLSLRPMARSLLAESYGWEQSPFGLTIREMQAIVDTAADGVILIGSDGEIRSMNAPAEALFGYDAENVIGKSFDVLFAIESKRTVRDYIAAMNEGGASSMLNDGRHVIGREAHGRFIPLFITLARLPDDKGYCAVLRDISYWKRIEEELTQARSQAERASSQKSDFLARVSHEIRTPLNAIIGFAELMIDEKFGPVENDRYRDYLRDIRRSASHVLELVNDLLDISKIEAGQQDMQFEPISLNEALEQAVAMMQPQANSERVIIRSSFGTRIPNVIADLRSIRQIALNLLSNAVRYTPAGGQIIVSTAYQPDGSVVLRIRDTGIGMTPAELEEALKPFRQINALERRRGDGTGLGLPLTRALVEANRAFFSINSTPGEGTLVEITFPPTRVLAD
jgi:PAS domain S-box